MKGKWISIDEAAGMLKVTPQAVLAMVRSHELPVAQFSLDVRIWRKAVEERAWRKGSREKSFRSSKQEVENA